MAMIYHQVSLITKATYQSSLPQNEFDRKSSQSTRNFDIEWECHKAFNFLDKSAKKLKIKISSEQGRS